MIHKIILIALFAVSPAIADVFEHPLKDRELAERTITSPEKTAGQFRQEKTINSLGVTLKSEGNFAINKNTGIFWQNLKPIKNTTIILKEKLCSFTDGKEVSSLDTADNQMLRHILNVINSVFAQDYIVMEKYFDLYFMQTEDGYTLGLKAKDSVLASVIEEMRVHGNKTAEKIEFSDKTGDTTVIYFTEITENVQNFSCPE